MAATPQWFETWFDSPYYPLLYQSRGEEEAKQFIAQIVRHRGIAPGQKVLDLACGSGRHSRTLESYGLKTFGYDISSNRIAEARAWSPTGICFKIHDMRQPFPDGKFDMVLNLFTSFGYFNSEEENHFILRNIYNSLKLKGCFVLDYLNVPYIIANLKEEDRIIVEDIDFQIKRYIADNKIFKEIEIIDGEKRLTFTEKIRAFEEKELDLLLHKCGFEIIEKWGNYQGNAYHPQHSPRLIFFARKIADS